MKFTQILFKVRPVLTLLCILTKVIQTKVITSLYLIYFCIYFLFNADSRFGGPQDPVSQYTTAATGLSDRGHIVAPDIFFSLRFANRPNDHQASVVNQDVPSKVKE